MAKMNWDKCRHVGKVHEPITPKKAPHPRAWLPHEPVGAQADDGNAVSSTVYLWNTKKPSKRVHIATDNGTYCKMENDRNLLSLLDGRAGEAPKGRKVCLVCRGQESVAAKRLHKEFDRRWRESVELETSW